MDKKQKRLVVAGQVFAGFLFLIAALNLVTGHVGAAVGCLGAGGFYLLILSALRIKAEKTDEDA